MGAQVDAVVHVSEPEDVIITVEEVHCLHGLRPVCHSTQVQPIDDFLVVLLSSVETSDPCGKV